MSNLLWRYLTALAGLALAYSLLAAYNAQPLAAAYLLQAVVIFIFGFWVLTRQREGKINRSFFYFSSSFSGYLLLVFSLHIAPAVGISAVAQIVWGLRFFFFLMIPTLIYFTYQFTGGESRLQRGLLICSVITVVPFFFSNLVGVYITEYKLAGKTYVPSGELLWYRAFAIAFMVWVVISAAVVGGNLAFTTLHRKRAQYILFLVGWGVSLAYALSGFLPAFNRLFFPSLAGIVWSFFPLCMGVAVLRYELFEFKLILRRTLPYAIGSSILGGMYASIILLFDRSELFDIINSDSRVQGFGLLLVMGLCFQPVLELSRQHLDRIFFRAEMEVDRFLGKLGSDLALCESSSEALQVSATAAESFFHSEYASATLADQHQQQKVSAESITNERESSLRELIPPLSQTLADSSCKTWQPPHPLLANSPWQAVSIIKMESSHLILALAEKRSHLTYSPYDMRLLKTISYQLLNALRRLDAEAQAESSSALIDNLFAALQFPIALICQRNQILRANEAFNRRISSGGSHLKSDLNMYLHQWDRKTPIDMKLGSNTYLASSQLIRNENDLQEEILMLTPVTELRKLQEKEQQNAVLTKLGLAITSINHEIQNVITPIDFYIRRLNFEGDKEKNQNAVNKILERVNLLKTLCGELKQYYKKPEYQFRNVTLNDLIESTLIDLKSIYPDLAMPTVKMPPLMLKADPQKLKQALLNLLKNAWESMLGSDHPEWIMCTEEVEQGMNLSIADTGSGIAPEILSNIFDPFVSTKQDGGTGLGLAICKTIIENHDARLSVHSRLGSGTTMTIHWPTESRIAESDES